MSCDGPVLLAVLGTPESSPEVGQMLDNVRRTSEQLLCTDFGNVRYASCKELGLSLQYEKRSSSAGWACQAVDLYNADAVKDWSCFSCLPLELTMNFETGRATMLQLHSRTNGIDLVEQLGEPTRKGGGEPLKGGGASGLGPGAWMEWNGHSNGKDILLMIELAGHAARGSERWEKDHAGSARWGVCTVSLRS